MKKLLSLLSTITIASSGVAGIVANSPYPTQEQQIKLENINYKRQKRSNNENNKINATKIVIKAKKQIWSSGIVFNNKVFFSSFDHNVYEYDPATGQQKIIIITNGETWSSGVVLNNKLYFGSFDHNVYEYDPATEQQKTIIRTKGRVQTSGVVFNNKIYFGSFDHNVYEYDPATGQQKVAITTNNEIKSSGVVLNSKLYFGSLDHNVYEYDPVAEQQKIIIRATESIRSSGVVFNNKLYFGSTDNNVYEYDPATEQQKIIIKTNWWIDSSGVIFNNKLYIGSGDGNVYEYSEYYLNSNLGKISNNSDNVILSELNYLNPDLDISQLEIINKTKNSAILKIKNNLNNNNIKIHYSIDNGQNKIINLNELIKKALFFKFRDENSNLKFKEINYIDTNNLNFSNTEITKQENSFLWSNVPKNVCSDREITNKTPNIKSFNVPACEYNSKSKLIFQITTGLTKTKQENKLNGWNINSDDEMKLTDFTNINNKNSEIINVLSNEFDLSNTNKREQEMILSIFKGPADKFELNPDKKLKITYPVRIITSKVILNLKQKITRNITAEIIDDNNKEQIVILSITEVMQILQNHSFITQWNYYI
ncbi:outer membrane protein assembly factor BamB family protein [Spiroplasma endosymbiont of 'Nebria riversi']|uniref:outer membrane protein assembly factor BamB family protein n=1 Tax=Spiroplasma endosymbiont of 'Nebria riversi' TaxID=2792084 RepID=UPI001C044874|nr:PQQ-binding-like beta-propeller repeat protein [Spiroplasma endosymbiont of 'Nebria riversi']